MAIIYRYDCWWLSILFDEEMILMTKIEKSININAPVEKVFSYMAEPTHLPEIWPNLKNVKDVILAEGRVSSYHWTYRMAGISFEGEAKIIESVPNQLVVVQNSGGIPSTFVWNYQSEDGGTQVTVEVEYTVPSALLGKLAKSFLTRQNEYDAEKVLANLKAKMEG
jgi:uncharacterized membrane protein